jgi:hypothetical protein
MMCQCLLPSGSARERLKWMIFTPKHTKTSTFRKKPPLVLKIQPAILATSGGLFCVFRYWQAFCQLLVLLLCCIFAAKVAGIDRLFD